MFSESRRKGAVRAAHGWISNRTPATSAVGSGVRFLVACRAAAFAATR
jgi:hypothetical protein